MPVEMQNPTFITSSDFHVLGRTREGMPSSKGKKAPRTRLPDRTVSTPSHGMHQSSHLVDGEGCSLPNLSLATSNFPGFIAESAFSGCVAANSSSWEQDGSGAHIWLSEKAMVSASFRPGSLVSVSLAASSGLFSEEFPLDSLTDSCAAYFGLDPEECRTSEPGKYFAIAKVFSSQKMLKNEVKLSWSLSSTMGFPAAGRTLFISPIGSIASSHSVDSGEDTYSSLSASTSLHLKLIPESITEIECTGGRTPVSVLKNSNFLLSSEVSSPKTPSSYQPMISSPFSHQNKASNLGRLAIREGFKDENSKELLRIYAARWLHGRYLLKGNILSLPIFGQLCNFQLEDSTTNISLVDSQTKLHMSHMPSVNELSNKDDIVKRDVGFRNLRQVPRLGGLTKEYALLKEIINFSFTHQSGLMRYKGVLLYGPPGTGKTTLACSCVRDIGANLFVINGPEIVCEYYGESELKLLEVFDSARSATPSVIFIDELDAIAPARKEGGEGLSRRIVATLLELMDGIIKSDGILVIAATNRPESIEPALRRPGRLDREIEIGVPTRDQRLDILSSILSRMHHDLTEEEIQSLALETHGFVGADLSALCNEAAMIALRRRIRKSSTTGFMPRFKQEEHRVETQVFDSTVLSLSKMDINSNDASDPPEKNKKNGFGYGGHSVAEELSDLRILNGDFLQAKLKIRPSAMREVMLEVPKVRWEDVGGQSNIKNQLIEAVRWPQICPDAFKRIGIRPPRGVLIFGPPGCSKTLMARAVASEAKLNFIAVKGPELLSKWVGESEKAVRSLFSKARANSPSIIFFDEIDGLATKRGSESDGTCVGDRVMNQLLTELDGLDERFGVTVIAATNRPDKIDSALIRPGRFDRHLDVKPPDGGAREEIFAIHMRDMPVGADVSVRELASLTNDYSGADIKLVCREAAIAALEESFDISEILMEHFRVAIGKVKPADVQFYLDIADKFRRFVDCNFEEGSS